jgi:hypothetical protein
MTCYWHKGFRRASDIYNCVNAGKEADVAITGMFEAHSDDANPSLIGHPDQSPIGSSPCICIGALLCKDAEWHSGTHGLE